MKLVLVKLGLMKNGLMNVLVMIFLAFLLQPAAVAGEPRKAFLLEFVQGKYLLVGKNVNSTNTYFGHVEIYSEAGELKVNRKIGSETSLGLATIEGAGRGETKVLRIRFGNGKLSYEHTCLIHGDLDNYARISCYIYLPEGGTTQPGLEVLFSDHAKSK